MHGNAAVKATLGSPVSSELETRPPLNEYQVSGITGQTTLLPVANKTYLVTTFGDQKKQTQKASLISSGRKCKVHSKVLQ